MSKFRWEALGVILFIILMLFMFAGEARADDTPEHQVGIGLGIGAANFNRGRTQSIEYTYNNRWLVGFERFGGGESWRSSSAVNVARVVERGGRNGPFMLLGATYTDRPIFAFEGSRAGKELVSENLTFRLGIGWRWDVSEVTEVRLGWMHNSTAGRSERNSGIDRLHLSFNWNL